MTDRSAATESRDAPRFDLWPETGHFETEPKKLILGRPVTSDHPVRRSGGSDVAPTSEGAEEAILGAGPTAGATLRDDQGGDVNYYVIVPFTTLAATEWASGEIGAMFDCHVVSAAAVSQDALVLSSVTGGDDA